MESWSRHRRPRFICTLRLFTLEGAATGRNGLVVTLRLEDFAPGKILPHERTFAAAKQDRLQLLSATQVNLSSIFGLYPGEHPELERLRERAAATRTAIRGARRSGDRQ